MKYSRSDIDAMERRSRAAFINSLPGIKPANLIGTIGADGQLNLSIVSSVVHIGSNPPLLAFMSRPLSVERHTLTNILETGVYTINAVPSERVGDAHQTAARYPRSVSEFDAAGFEPRFDSDFAAPFVAGSIPTIGMRYLSRQELPNETVLVLGEVDRVYVDETAVAADGSIDFTQLNVAAVTGLDTYYRGVKLGRFAYAKPDNPPRSIER